MNHNVTPIARIVHWIVDLFALASLVQAANRKARGYCNHDAFVLMAYVIAGKWDLESTKQHDVELKVSRSSVSVGTEGQPCTYVLG